MAKTEKIITVNGISRTYKGVEISHQRDLPKSAKSFCYDYTKDLKKEISIYYTPTTKGLKFFILIK